MRKTRFVMIKKYFPVSLLLGGLLVSARAQLAITEVVSSGSTNLGAALVASKSDWWELSNFGTNAINLTGYKWNDNAGGLIGGDALPFNGLVIQPGESIVFVETLANICTNETQFRAWWGPSLGAAVRFALLRQRPRQRRRWRPPLGAVRDGRRELCGQRGFPDGAARFLVHLRHELGRVSRPGQFSTNGVNGAFKAVRRTTSVRRA